MATHLGMVPDLMYSEEAGAYLPEAGYRCLLPEAAETTWQPTHHRGEAATLELSLPAAPGAEGFTLLLSVAAQYGRLDLGGVLEPAAKAIVRRSWQRNSLEFRVFSRKMRGGELKIRDSSFMF